MKGWKILLATALMWLSGCASEVVRSPASLSAVDQKPNRQYVVLHPASIRLDSGYDRTIKAGTELTEVGVIKQGKVLKTVNATFTIEGAHMHEAYLVMDNNQIIGFYLPVEGAFSPLSQFVNLSIQERRP